MSLQILLAILVSANTSEDESPVPAEEKPPSLTRCHPLADPRAEAIHRQAAGSNYLAELPEHFREALLPGAAAQGYCNVGGQEIGTEAAAPQVVLPRRLRADHSQGWSLVEPVSHLSGSTRVRRDNGVRRDRPQLGALCSKPSEPSSKHS